MSTSFEFDRTVSVDPERYLVPDPILDSAPYNASVRPSLEPHSTAPGTEHSLPVSDKEKAACFLQEIADQHSATTLAKISLWLNGSRDDLRPDHYLPSACPKSQEWLNANKSKIQEQLTQDFSNLSRKHVAADSSHFENTLNSGKPIDVFKLHELAYMGIEHTVKDLSQARSNPEVSVNDINALTIKLVSATAVRAFYLSDLTNDTEAVERVYATNVSAREHTKNRDQDGSQPYGEVFKQNILSAIYAIARLDSPKQPHAGEPPASSHL